MRYLRDASMGAILETASQTTIYNGVVMNTEYYGRPYSRASAAPVVVGLARNLPALRCTGASFFQRHMHNTMHNGVHNESRPVHDRTAHRVVFRGFMPGAGLEPACLAAEDFKSPLLNID